MFESPPKISRVLVTGASGFVGRHVISELLKQGYAVAALVRHFSSFHRPEVAVYQGDILQASSLLNAAEGCDAIIHLVGIIAESKKRRTFQRVHVEGTCNVIQAAKVVGIKRLIHMSALGTRPNAISRYHQTKWEAEQAVVASGLDYTIFRPSMILGHDGDFSKMLRRWACGKAPPFLFMPFFGSGLFGQCNPHQLQPIHVDDLAELFCCCVQNAESVGKIYEVGGPDVVTWKTLLTKAAHAYKPPGRNPKRVIGIPVWWAKLMASLPLPLPFNLDQVQMSQEDNACDLAPIQTDFPTFHPRPFVVALKNEHTSLR